MERAKVYFTREITEMSLVKMYDKLGIDLPGRVCVKLHSGEEGNQNYLHPELMREIIKKVNGVVVECNTAYEGARNTTEKHQKLIAKHGWNKYYDVDILDAEGPDKILDIEKGKIIKKDYVGNHLENYDSMLVISHFKGHPMGGYGGALKQLSIGVASSYGKRYIHCAGKDEATYEDMFKTNQNSFLEAMADAASAVHNYFKGKIAYINIMANLSVDCDCCKVAEDPCMKDIGVMVSLDPIAIDKACLDLIYNSKDPGKKHLIERIESRNGTHIIEAACALDFGNSSYELIDID